MATALPKAHQRFLLHDVEWPTYTRLLRALGHRPGVRLTYDHGTLEFMTLSHEHENLAHLLGRLVIALTEELGLPVNGGGSTTFRRQDRQRGLEPDECFWIAHEPDVRGKDKIDLRKDPPPDLALEIDITHSSLNRLAIYAALGVPEVWRFDGKTLDCLVLRAQGYRTAASKAFPPIPVPELAQFLRLRTRTDQNSIVHQFRIWVRQRLRGDGASPSPR